MATRRSDAVSKEFVDKQHFDKTAEMARASIEAGIAEYGQAVVHVYVSNLGFRHGVAIRAALDAVANEYRDAGWKTRWEGDNMGGDFSFFFDQTP